jgi:aryl-alcohol dehydrogenase-like predicted oxidoreductase
MAKLGGTDIDVSALCLGGNVFGWTADEAASQAVLDAFTEGGGNFVDTADVYSAWVPGNSGGESEAILGRWMAARGNRDAVVIATKCGALTGVNGLGADTVRRAVEGSLERLQSDYIDLLYAHVDDADTPLEETLGAFDALVKEGKVRAIAASNYSPERLEEALAISEREGLASYVALQPAYNLVERDYEGELEGVVAKHGLATVPYYGLASGFLTGKYRPGGNKVDSPRAEAASKYLENGGVAVLEALDEVAAAHSTSVAAVALAWLAAQPTVAAPIASARTTEQLADLLPVLTLQLGEDELARLSAAGA